MVQQEEAAPAANSPLLRELRAELDRQAEDAVLAAAEQAREEVLQTAAATARERTRSAEELFAKWKSEIEKMQAAAREQFFAQVAAKQDEALGTLKSGFEEKFGQARELLGEITRQAETLRAESGNAQEATQPDSARTAAIGSGRRGPHQQSGGAVERRNRGAGERCSLLAAATGIGNDGGAGANGTSCCNLRWIII